MRGKLILLFTHGLTVGGTTCYLLRAGFEWLPFIILCMVSYSTYAQIRYYNN